MPETITEPKKKVIRKPAVITEGNGNMVKFQNDVDEFIKNNNVVEKHFSMTMLPIEKKATMIQGIGRGYNMQLQMVPVCYMVVEEEIEINEPIKLYS